MHVTFDWENLIIENGKTFRADCQVRNEINGERMADQVVQTYEKNGVRRPYMPRTIPSGLWKITEVVWIDDESSEYWPVLVRTDAKRYVYLWQLHNGRYIHRTNSFAVDLGYHMHHARYNGSRSRTTHGCINFWTPEIAIDFAETVEPELKADRLVTLEVM